MRAVGASDGEYEVVAIDRRRLCASSARRLLAKSDSPTPTTTPCGLLGSVAPPRGRSPVSAGTWRRTASRVSPRVQAGNAKVVRVVHSSGQVPDRANVPLVVIDHAAAVRRLAEKEHPSQLSRADGPRRLKENESSLKRDNWVCPSRDIAVCAGNGGAVGAVDHVRTTPTETLRSRKRTLKQLSPNTSAVRRQPVKLARIKPARPSVGKSRRRPWGLKDQEKSHGLRLNFHLFARRSSARLENPSSLGERCPPSGRLWAP